MYCTCSQTLSILLGGALNVTWTADKILSIKFTQGDNDNNVDREKYSSKKNGIEKNEQQGGAEIENVYILQT